MCVWKIWANIYTLCSWHHPCFSIVSHLEDVTASQLFNGSLLHKLNVSVFLRDNSLANKCINLFVSFNYAVSWAVLNNSFCTPTPHSSLRNGWILSVGNAFLWSQERRCPWRPPIRSCWSSTPRVASRPGDFTLSTKVTPTPLSSPG